MCPRPALSLARTVSPVICGHRNIRGPLSAATSPLGTPTLGTATGCQRREVPGTGSRSQGLCSPLVTCGTSSPTPGPPQQGMELRTAEEEQLPSWGTACSREKVLFSPFPFPVQPISNNQVGQSCRWGLPVLWVLGNGLPSTVGALPAGSMPWMRPDAHQYV